MKKLLFASQALLFSLSTHVVLAADKVEIPLPANVPEGVTVGKVISAGVGVLIIVAAIAAFLYLILGGIQWITSGGDKTALESARNKITNAIVGLIIVAAAWAIMLLVGKFIGIDITNMNIPTIGNPRGN